MRFNPEIEFSNLWMVTRKASRTKLRSPNGNRYSLYLYWNGGRWNWNYNWLDNDRDADYLSALATIFISPPHLVWSEEFCFRICPIHPPSIFPASSRISESAIYCLISSDFTSQRTMSRILSVSSLRIARRIHGSFSSRGKNTACAVASMLSMSKVSILLPNE